MPPAEEPGEAQLVGYLALLPPQEANVQLLTTLAETAPKRLAKEARRLLHRWRSQGLVGPEPAVAGARWRLESGPRPLEALLSQVDGEGGRLVVYSFSRPAHPYVVLTAIGLDTQGVVQAEVYEPTNRRSYQNLLQALRSLEDLTLVAAAPHYGRALLQHYYRLSREQHRPVPRDFELYRPSLGEDEPLPPPLIYTRLSADEVRAGRHLLLAHSAELLAEEEMESWLLSGPPVEEAAARLQDRDRSPLIISQHAQEELAQRTRQQLLETVFQPGFRRLFARRLEEMAYVFWETERALRARQAVALAQVLQEETTLLFIPFFQKLVERSLAYATAQEEKKTAPSRRHGLYLPNWSFSPFTVPRPPRAAEPAQGARAAFRRLRPR